MYLLVHGYQEVSADPIDDQEFDYWEYPIRSEDQPRLIRLLVVPKAEEVAESPRLRLSLKDRSAFLHEVVLPLLQNFGVRSSAPLVHWHGGFGSIGCLWEVTIIFLLLQPLLLSLLPVLFVHLSQLSIVLLPYLLQLVPHIGLQLRVIKVIAAVLVLLFLIVILVIILIGLIKILSMRTFSVKLLEPLISFSLFGLLSLNLW